MGHQGPRVGAMSRSIWAGCSLGGNEALPGQGGDLLLTTGVSSATAQVLLMMPPGAVMGRCRSIPGITITGPLSDTESGSSQLRG